MTRSFPVLLNQIKSAEAPKLRRDLAVVVSDCCILNPKLRDFHKKADEWLQFMNDFVREALADQANGPVAIALTCLLVFERQRDLILAESPELVNVIEKATEHSEAQVRCLANLILADLKIPFPILTNLDGEPHPFVRAARVIRTVVMLCSLPSDSPMAGDLRMSIAVGLNDMSPIVRCESLVAISFGMISDRFGEVAKLLTQNDNSSPLSLVLRLGLWASHTIHPTRLSLCLQI
jgi:hypothetical protein